jgi:GTP-binding protein
LELELKLIADVGLLGEPNAGKSTLLSVITAARPKIGDYPFTTLQPNLGVVALSGGRSFVVADIPGIIEGAHEGKGLGFTFLRHVERTRVLAVLIPLDAEDAQVVYDRLRHEIRLHSESLWLRPHLVLFTKRDLLPLGDPIPELHAPEAAGVLTISAAGQVGLEALVEQLWGLVARARAEDARPLHPDAEFDE